MAVLGLLVALLPVAPATASHIGELELIPTLVMPGQQAGAPGTPAAADPACAGGTRSMTDRPDVYDGRLIHVIYLLPAGVADESLDVNGTLECSILGQNSWLRSQIGLEWRFDTYFDASGSELVDITFVRSARPPGQLSEGNGVRAELQTLGFATAGKRYLAYVVAGQGGGRCGDAFYPTTQTTPGVDGQYSHVYLDAAAGCHARDFGTAESPSWSEAIAQQELMHNDGLTPIGAPHSCTNNIPYAHVCTGPLWAAYSFDPERIDVMFPYVTGPLSGKVVDIGHDDYHAHGLPLLELTDSPYLRVPGAEKPKSTAPTQPGPQPSPTPSPSPQPSPSPSGSPQPTPEPSPSSTPEPSPEPSPEPEAVPSEQQAERSISLNGDRGRVAEGQRVKLVADISSIARCANGQIVELQAKRAGSDRPFRTIDEAISNDEGRAVFRIAPRVSRRYRAVLVETEQCAAARTKPHTITVY